MNLIIDLLGLDLYVEDELTKNTIREKLLSCFTRNELNSEYFRCHDLICRWAGWYTIFIFDISNGREYFRVTITISDKRNVINLTFKPNQVGNKGMVNLRNFLIEMVGVDLARSVYYEAEIKRFDISVSDNFALAMSCYSYLRRAREYKSQHELDYYGRRLRLQIEASGKSTLRLTVNGNNEPNGEVSGLTIADMVEYDANICLFNLCFLSETVFDLKFRNHVKEYGLDFALNQCSEKTRLRYLHLLEKFYREHSSVVLDDMLSNITTLLHPLKSSNYVPSSQRL